MPSPMRTFVLVLFGIAILSIAGCKTIGWRFPHDTIDIMMIGETSLTEVRTILGEPFRIGNENGRIIWTYVDYYFGLFGDIRMRDLRLRFDEENRLVSYEYNSNIRNEHEAFRERVTR